MTPAEKRAHELPPDPRETFQVFSIMSGSFPLTPCQVRIDFIKEHCPLPGKKELEAMFKKDRRLTKDKRVKVGDHARLLRIVSWQLF